MNILIGKDKAELFATVYEDKDIAENGTNGSTNGENKNMGLHNNGLARNIGEANPEVTENEVADIICTDLYQEYTEFVWLHE